MAGIRTNRQFYNFIWIAVFLALLVVSLVGFSGSADSLALEQEARCGLEEHIHTEECYVGDVLVCNVKLHTHSENCYLLLLEDNDINWLLRVMSRMEEKSLEGVLDSALGQALVLNENFAEATPPVTLTSDDISSLNDTIEENEIEPAVVLNEDLSYGSTLAYTPSDTYAVEDGIETAEAIDSNVMSAIVTDATSNSDNQANFYVYFIDEEGNAGWAYIGTETFSTRSTGSGWTSTTYYAVATSDVLSVINDAMGLSYTRTTLPTAYYATYDNEDTWSTTGSAQISNTYYTTMGTRGWFSGDTSARYVYIGAGSTSTAAANTRFFRVSYDYTSDYTGSGTDSTAYNTIGSSITLPTLSNGFVWQDQDGNPYNGGTTVTPSKSLSLTTVKTVTTVTVTFMIDGEKDSSTTINPGSTVSPPEETTKTGYTFDGWYTDAAYTTEFDFDNTTITQDTTLYARWTQNRYTVTFETGGGSAVASQTVGYGETASKPSDPTRTGYTFGGWYTDQACTAAFDFATAINGDLTLYAKWTQEAVTGDSLTVSYDVNFPTSISSDGYGATLAEAEPTLVGANNAVVADGGTAALLNVSDQNVSAGLALGSTRYLVVHFTGWLTEQGNVLSPGTNLSWDNLSAYDADGDGTVQLEGQWVYYDLSSANFFIKYNSKPNSSETASTYYTSVVFSTYVGGIDTDDSASDLNDAYGINESIYEEDYGVTPTYLQLDELISKLEGQKEEGVWLAQMPSDADMIGKLQSLGEELEVEDPDNPGSFLAVDEDGTETPDDPTDDLNTQNYSLRWYQFMVAHEGGSVYTWHIDGLLVKKQGNITVDKQFLGDDAAVEAAKESFYIVAENGTKNADGSFTAYTSDNSKFKQYLLVLDERVGTALAATYPDATILVYHTAESDAADHYYEWLIEGVTTGEYWQITEHTDTVTVNGTDYIYYAEYSVYDTDGEVTAIAEYGTQASVVGKTFALDEDPDQGLLVDFRNYYYGEDNILLKKEDAKTGQPIGGAAFQILQNDKVLNFSVDENTGIYTQDPDSTDSWIETGDDGFAVIDGFSYQYGADDGGYSKLVIREITAPTGYDLAPDVELGVDDSDNVIVKDIRYNEGHTIEAADWDDYAEVPENGVLVVKDRVSEYVTVNVTKQWDPVEAAESKVVLVLQANGSRATGTFPTLSNAEVTVDASTNWAYTWTDLPAYANGELVTWGIKEIVIGSESTLADGESFANWTYTSTLTNLEDSDGDGINDVWGFVVTNSQRRSQIILTKVDQNGAALSGAEFTLEEVELVDGQWQTVSGALTDTQTTNQYGLINFDDLTAGIYYRLTETAAPDGYVKTLGSIMLTVNGEGLVQQVATDGTYTVLDGTYISYTRPYNIQVVNLKTEPLPETGGMGGNVYTQGGLLLMILAAALLVYKRMPQKTANAAGENLTQEAGFKEAEQRMPAGQPLRSRLRQNHSLSPPEPVPRGSPNLYGKEEHDSS